MSGTRRSLAVKIALSGPITNIPFIPFGPVLGEQVSRRDRIVCASRLRWLLEDNLHLQIDGEE
jgi:hypothetical protein